LGEASMRLYKASAKHLPGFTRLDFKVLETALKQCCPVVEFLIRCEDLGPGAAPQGGTGYRRFDTHLDFKVLETALKQYCLVVDTCQDSEAQRRGAAGMPKPNLRPLSRIGGVAQGWLSRICNTYRGSEAWRSRNA